MKHRYWHKVQRNGTDSSSTCSSNSDSGSGNSDSGSGNSDSGSGNSDSGSGNSDSGSNSQDGVCVSSCKFMKDGDYQSCKRCDGFVKCANERLFEMDCAEGKSKYVIVNS